MTSIAVLGIGNSLLRDDGVGIHAMNLFAARNAHPDVRCVDAGTIGLALMDRLARLDGLVALDAMRLGKAPGTVTVLQGAAMDEHLRNHHGSVHELGLSDLLDALRLSGDLPPQRALVGIEPECIDWGTAPSATVAAAIPDAAARVADLVRDWRTAGLENPS
ncbi:MAG: hydrogenase maturation protease [Gammaproteobacteria bacterium]|nr:hydrogenase maturation protease [Gammaproteobacteria bacterium]